MTQCNLSFACTQSGSGDPSPTNVRPINYWEGFNISISPTQQSSDGTTYTASWANVGKMCKGTVDAINGILAPTWEMLTYNGSANEDWHVENSYNFYIMTPSRFMRNTNSERLWCNMAMSRTGLSTGTCKISASGNFNIMIGSLIGITTVSAFKEWLSEHPLQVACEYKIGEKPTHSITPQNIKTLSGINHITSDMTSMSIKYWTH